MEEGMWTPRALGQPKLESQVKQEEVVQVKQKAAGPHRFSPEEALHYGRLGGKKGGAARSLVLSKGERSEIARKGAQAMWAKRKAQNA